MTVDRDGRGDACVQGDERRSEAGRLLQDKLKVDPRELRMEPDHLFGRFAYL